MMTHTTQYYTIHYLTDPRKRRATELLDMLLPIVPLSLLSARNRAGSTALHWAALNSQLGTAHALVEYPGGPGIDLIDMKNATGRSPLGEAEAAGWDEGAKWMVEVMRLVDAGGAGAAAAAAEEEDEEDTNGRAAGISVEEPGGGPPSS
jgi:hypothetical protein